MTSWRTAPDSQDLPAKAALAFVVSVVGPALYVISATRLRTELCPSDTFVHGVMELGGASVAGMMLFIFSCPACARFWMTSLMLSDLPQPRLLAGLRLGPPLLELVASPGFSVDGSGRYHCGGPTGRLLHPHPLALMLAWDDVGIVRAQCYARMRRSRHHGPMSMCSERQEGSDHGEIIDYH